MLFILDTDCPFCRNTIPTWNSIFTQLTSTESVEVLGLSIDGPEETATYVAESRIVFPVAVFPNEKFIELYRANGVPTTVVVDEKGVVAYARIGEIRDHVVADSVIEAALRTAEPGEQQGVQQN